MAPEACSTSRSDRRRLGLKSLQAVGIVVLALFGVEEPDASEPPAGQDAAFVCAQVVLAIDGSKSTGDGAFRRQIEAFRAALGSARLYRAIQDCLPGSIGLAVITWSGPNQQDLCLGWTVVAHPGDGRHLAGHLNSCEYFGGTTDIGRAIDYGMSVLAGAPFASFYRAVLVLTNGRTDPGGEADLAAARTEAVAATVTLAGHALLRPRPKSGSPFSVPDAVRLERYVADRVSAGPRSFTSHSRPADDARALLRALVEILRQEGS